MKKYYLTAFLLLPLMAQAGVYKWVDANGRTHFGDRPPKEVASSEVRIDAAPTTPDASADERLKKVNEFVSQRQAEREARKAEEAKAARQAEKQRALCRKLQARLKHMESISTFYNLNDQGEKVYVSEADNTRIRERFQARVKQTCNS